MMSPLLFRRSVQGLLTALLCLGAGACTHADGSGSSLEQTIAVSSPPAVAGDVMALAPSGIGQSQALAGLPEAAGHVTSVRVHHYVNGLRQDIVLDGSAVKSIHNGLTVVTRTSTTPTLDEGAPLIKPTEAAIRAEIGAEFPHIAMQVVERESSNAYGPYGLALGRTGDNLRCLYMWQWIDTNRLPQDAGIDGPVSVRVRLCQSGTSFDAMAALVDHLTIGGASTDVAAPIVADVAPVRHEVRHRKIARGSASHLARRDRHDIASAPDLAAAASSTGSAPSAALADAKPGLSSDLPPEAYLGPKAAGTASVRSY